MDERYCLAFDGRVADGFAVEQVRHNLASLLHLKESQIERLFGGTPVVVKRNLGKGQAIKYRNMLAKTGALLLIRPEAPAPVSSEPAAVVAVTEAAAPLAQAAATDVAVAEVVGTERSGDERAPSPVVAEPASAAVPASAESVDPAVASATAELECPRCGEHQSASEQCVRCHMDLRLHRLRLAKRARVRRS
ncbi:MAG: hypothetical protein RBS88_00275 [Spongiibacteraceae bacterium]|jgi:hypothetical protein|nr:hypothetical protein [Spongiibacteraceae bacterium]